MAVTVDRSRAPGRSPAAGPRRWSRPAAAAVIALALSPIVVAALSLVGDTWYLWTAAAVNALAVAGIAAVAWRRGRWPLLVGMLTVVALLVHNLGPNVAVSLWNPHVPLLPWLYAVFLAWDVALGHRGALWWQPGERYDRLLTIAVDPGAALPPDAVAQCENDPTARKLAEYSVLAPEDIAWLARFENERFFDPGSATRAELARAQELGDRRLRVAVYEGPRVCARPPRPTHQDD